MTRVLNILFLLIITFSSNELCGQEMSDSVKQKILKLYALHNTDGEKALEMALELFANKEDYSTFDKASIYLMLIDFQNAESYYEEAIANSADVLAIAKKHSYQDYIVLSKFYMANAYTDNYEFDKAFQIYESLVGPIHLGSDEYLTNVSKHSMAFIYRRIGRYRAALDLNLEVYRSKNHDLLQNNTGLYGSLLLHIADLYNEIGIKDSAIWYTQAHKKLVLENSEVVMWEYKLQKNEGNVLFKEGNFEGAIEKYSYYQSYVFDRVREFDENVTVRKSIAHYKLGQLDSALSNLNMIAADKNYKKKLPFLPPEYFKLYADIYAEKENDSLSKVYQEKFHTAQENFSNFKLSALEKLHGLDTQEIVLTGKNEKKKYQNYIHYQWLVAGGLLGLAIFVFVLKHKRDQKKFTRLMQRFNTESIKVRDESKTSQNLTINDEKVSELIKQIAILNEEGFFLKQKTTLYNTAKKLKTNTSYLSNVINNHLNTTFNSFVNDIRINFIVNELKNNSQMRSYSVKAISEEIGYKSADSFTKYFKQNTGLSPSSFIRKINKEY